jgi:hypothetical protein
MRLLSLRHLISAAATLLFIGAAAAQPISVSPSEQFIVKAARHGTDGSGNSVVVWATGNDPFAVFARRVSSAGSFLGSVVRVSPPEQFVSHRPSVAVNDFGNVVVAWRTGNDPYGVFAQRYDAQGAPAGPVFQVTAQYVWRTPAVAMNQSGAFAIAWTSEPAVFVQRFAASGEPVGAVIQVSPPEQRVYWSMPAIGMDQSGRFTVAWINDDPPYSVFARQYDANGAPMSAAFAVSPPDHFVSWGEESDVGRPPAIAMNPSGSAVIAWVKEGEPYAAFAQRYSSKGAAVGSAFQVSPPGHIVNRSGPSAAIDAMGNFLVAWHDDANFGSWAQRFGPGGKPVGSMVFVTWRSENGDQPAAPSATLTREMIFAWTAWPTAYLQNFGSSLRRR